MPGPAPRGRNGSGGNAKIHNKKALITTHGHKYLEQTSSTVNEVVKKTDVAPSNPANLSSGQRVDMSKRSWANVVAGGNKANPNQEIEPVASTQQRGAITSSQNTSPSISSQDTSESGSGSHASLQSSQLKHSETKSGKSQNSSDSATCYDERNSAETGPLALQTSGSSSAQRSDGSLERKTKRNRRQRGRGKGNKQELEFQNGQMSSNATQSDMSVKASKAMGSAGKNKTKKDCAYILKLPNEILLQILTKVLSYDGVITVSPTFAPIEGSTKKTPVNYSVLHSCVRLYELGLPLYYSLNTWAIDIGKFLHSPETMETWPDQLGFSYAVEYVRNIIIVSFTSQSFDDSVFLLKGFRNLESVVFDMRDGSQTREFTTDPKVNPYEEVEASPSLKALLEKAQVRIRKVNYEGNQRVFSPGRIMVANTDKKLAEEHMEPWLYSCLRMGMVSWIRLQKKKMMMIMNSVPKEGKTASGATAEEEHTAELGASSQ